MKNLILLFSFVLLTLNLNSQSCNDLIVSEVVFGNLSGKGTQYNHSVEVFNPTSSAIDLVNYKIELVPETGQSTIIDLSGIVPPEDVYVISNVTANGAIISVSDVLETLLSFDGFVAIQLTKNSGEVVDKFGRQGVSQTSSTIDLAALLNDPTYLNSLDINLGSIENLLVRRSNLVQKGNTDFSNEDLLKEWLLFPNYEINHLGTHSNACLAPVLSWDNIDQFLPDAERMEETGVPPVPVIGTIVSTVPLTDNVLILIDDVNSFNFTFPGASPATYLGDYNYIGNTEFPLELQLFLGTDNWDIDLLEVIDDFELELDEGAGFTFQVLSTNTDVTVADNFDHFDILIKDNETMSTEKALLLKEIKISPTIVQNRLKIEVGKDNDIQIRGVKIFGLNSKQQFESSYNDLKEVEIDLSSFSSFGYHVVYILTNKGGISRKIIKTH